MENETNTPTTVSRRQFLKHSSLAAAAMSTVSMPSLIGAAAKQPMNAVIIGLGGRGGGAGGNFLEACQKTGVEGKIVAVADIFESRAASGTKNFKLPANKCYSGFDAYMKALAEPGVNYAIIATPPGFRPSIFKAAIDAGKHVFMEKPVAVDGVGARVMYATGEKADAKNLKVAAGTQRRHQAGYLETIAKIHEGAIGDITSLRAYWVNGGPIWHRGVNGSSDLEVQINNWYHYIWLCGDHICEQHVHNLDVCNWIMQGHPVKCWGMGGRQMLGDSPGEIWDNFAVEYEYENGVRIASYCGQIRRSWSSVSEAVTGTKGTADPGGMIRATGERPWRFRGQQENPYVQEHINLINAIQNDTKLNETKNVTDSTMTAIMGREAAYSGTGVEWDAALNANFKYAPELAYEQADKMTWGAFRTLRPPLPGKHNILSDPPMVSVS